MSPRFEIRPLGVWDKPKTQDPRLATFRRDWESTLTELKHEVDLLGGEVIACQIDVTDGAIRRDGMLRSGTRVTGFQGVKLSFESVHGPLTYATDTFLFWRDNVRAIALGLKALRAVDRYGITRSGEQYRGWTAIAAAPAEKTLTVDEAVRLIADEASVRAEFVQGFADILINASSSQPIVDGESVVEARDAINKLYRLGARRAHPDAGGTADAFRLLTAARDLLLGGGQA